MEIVDTLIKGIEGNGKWISAIIVLGATTSLFVIISASFGKREFKFQGLEIPIKFFPLLFAGLTTLHAYLTWLFVKKIEALANLSSPISNAKAWASIQNTSGILFSGMEKRKFVNEGGPFGQPSYIINQYDPAAWLSIAFVVTAYIATVSALWKSSHPILTRLEAISAAFLLASLLSFTNWYIGSQWAIAASRLAQ